MPKRVKQAGVPIISLFSGAGGLDLGFSHAGFETVAAFENDAACRLTYDHEFGTGRSIKADLGKLREPAILEALAGRRPARGIVGGPPCQGFSRGNVLRDPHDVRNRLPHAFSRFISIVQKTTTLDFFVLENVPGLLQPQHAGLWSRLRSKLAKLGFNLYCQELNALDFGVAQVRRRLFLVGIHDRFQKPYKAPIGRSEPRSLESVIGGLPEPVFYQRNIDPESIPFHKNHWTMQPKSSRFHNQDFNRWRSFRILDWNRPSPTVAYGNREVHIHPDGRRRLSVYEAMLLQGFPKRFRIYGNLSEQFSQVSNAVPPRMAQRVAESIFSVIEGV
jgi:DNA (cytosine-5)-methyltransferase 1